MRLRSFTVRQRKPIEFVKLEGLSNVVVLAGPNGVGKTRIVQSLLGLFKEPNPSDGLHLVLEATNQTERSGWAKKHLDSRNAEDAGKIRSTLHRNQRRVKYTSSVIYFESNRSVSKIKAYPFSWEMPDPDEEDIGWSIGLNTLTSRFEDMQHSLFRKVESQRRAIATRATSMQAAGHPSMLLDFPDPLIDFKTAFGRLLAPKIMLDADVKTQQLRYSSGGEPLTFDNLSSGEREVVNIVFDFLLRSPNDCIVIFDEPELHLHPELSYRLLQTLTAIGKNNQFIFCTHSPDIISASIDNSVFFISPPRATGENQAIPVDRNDNTYQALQLLGQSIGVISLGRRLVLIEGRDASLDKQTYGAILRNSFPEFVLVPSGGHSTIKSFASVREGVINRTIWGVEFFLLCDGDGVSALGPRSVAAVEDARIKRLPRYHLENYFLSAATIVAAFADIESEESWLRDEAAITQKILEFARQQLSYAVALRVSALHREIVGNINIMPSAVTDINLEQLIEKFAAETTGELERVSAGLDLQRIDQALRDAHQEIAASFENDTWHKFVPGKPIVAKLCTAAGIKKGHFINLYIKAAHVRNDGAFRDIEQIFEGFSGVVQAG